MGLWTRPVDTQDADNRAIPKGSYYQPKRENSLVAVNTLRETSREDFSSQIVKAPTSRRSAHNPAHYVFLMFVFSIPFQNVEIRYVTSGVFSIANLLGLLFFGFYLFYRNIFRNSLPGVPVALRWFIAYLIVYAWGGFFIGDEPVRGFIVRLITLIQIFGFVWCAADVLKDESSAKNCLLIFALSGVILAIGTLLHLPGFVLTADADDRASALGMNPNRVAGLMVYAALICTAFCLNEAHWSRKRKLFLFSLTLPLFAMLVATGSRAGIGAFLIGIWIFLLARGGLKRKIIASLLVGLGVAVVLFLVVSNPTASKRWERFFEAGDTAGRGEIFGVALEMIGERPILGWGRGGFQELGSRLGLQHSRDAHNFILYLLIEVGLIGTVLFLIGLGLCLLAAWKSRAGPLGILPLTLLVSSLAMMMTHTGITAKTLWLIVALTLAAAAREKKFGTAELTDASAAKYRIELRKRAFILGAAGPRRP